MNVNGEGSNTEMMQKHAVTKQAVYQGGLRHDIVNLLLSDLLDHSQSGILNAKSGNLFDLKVISDADAQVIFKLVFREKVSLSEIVFTAGSAPETGRPSLVKIYSNRATSDFSDITDIAPGAEITLKDTPEPQTVVLAGKNFARISSLQIFIEENHLGSESTFLEGLKISGSAAPNYHVEYKSK